MTPNRIIHILGWGLGVIMVLYGLGTGTSTVVGWIIISTNSILFRLDDL